MRLDAYWQAKMKQLHHKGEQDWEAPNSPLWLTAKKYVCPDRQVLPASAQSHWLFILTKSGYFLDCSIQNSRSITKHANSWQRLTTKYRVCGTNYTGVIRGRHRTTTNTHQTIMSINETTNPSQMEESQQAPSALRRGENTLLIALCVILVREIALATS